MKNHAWLIRLSVLLMAILLLAPVYSLGQDYQVKWGEMFKVKQQTSLVRVLGYDKQGYYFLHRRYNKLYVNYFDLNHQLKAINKLDVNYNGQKMEYQMEIQLKDQFILFTSYKNSAHGKDYLFVQSFDPKTATLGEKPKKVAEIDLPSGSLSGGHYRFAVSRDTSKIAVYYYPPYRKKQPETVGVAVLDDAMNVLWTKEEQLPYQDHQIKVRLKKVDNQGNVYLSGMEDEDKELAREHKGEDRYYHHLLAFFDEGQTMRDFQYETADKLISQLVYTTTENDKLMIGGFYANEPDPKEKEKPGMKGSAFMTVDPQTQTITKPVFSAFSKDFIFENYSEKGKQETEKELAKKGEEPTLKDYILRNIVVRDDGGAALVGEQYYERVTRSNDGSDDHHFHHNSIVVISLNSAGNIEWAHKIPKKQYAQHNGDFFASYVTAVVEDKLYFLFNEHPANANKKPGEARARFRPGSDVVIAVYSVDSQGNIEQKTSITQEKKAPVLRAQICRQVGKKEVFLYTHWGLKRQMGNFVLE